MSGMIQRASILMLWPSTHPSSGAHPGMRRHTPELPILGVAHEHADPSHLTGLLRYPASGHDAAAPPTINAPPFHSITSSARANVPSAAPSVTGGSARSLNASTLKSGG